MLGTTLAGIKLENPTVLASGILGVSGELLVRVAENGAGAVTTKSFSLEERPGHPNPCILTFKEGMINAVGLSNAGVKNTLEEIKYANKNTKKLVIPSIFASTTKDFGKIAKELSKLNPKAVEVNISCPNVEAEFGKPFASDPKIAAEVTRLVKKNIKSKVIMKLSPNVHNIGEIAKAVEKAGADAVNAVNTLGPGMIINIEAKKPVLSNKTGGLSGPAIKPIAVRCVYDIYKATKLPIIGTGGVTTGRDAIEMIMAGASAVGIGSGVYYRGMDIFKKVCKEIEMFMKKEGYSSIKQMRGVAHD